MPVVFVDHLHLLLHVYSVLFRFRFSTSIYSNNRFHVIMIYYQKKSFHAMFQIAVFIALCSSYAAMAAPSLSEERLAAKPYYLKPVFDIAGFEITSVPIILSLIGGYIIYVGVFKGGKAEASHILVTDSTDETRQKLEKVKEDIGDDIEKFRKHAREMSACPSGKSSGGYLGRFGTGTMVPPFEKCLWDPKNEEGKVAGPVQTNFGWHLIFIHKRQKPLFE